MSSTEPYSFIERSVMPQSQVYDDYERALSAQTNDLDVQIRSFLRRHHPDHILTVVPEMNVSLLRFAAAGHASARLDNENETSVSYRGYLRFPSKGTGTMAEAFKYAKYQYKVKGEEFIVYNVVIGLASFQYILKNPEPDESPESPHSKLTDALLAAIGEWARPPVTNDIVYVYDRRWMGSTEMFKQVEKASWDNVILDSDMKEALTTIAKKFFDSQDVYKNLGVAWYRGIIFHGPAGNGKTISIKALMHTLRYREKPIPSLYVKSAPNTYDIRAIFSFARQMQPCLLILEDIDTIVTPATRSYFFNEVDGLENNNGILLVASTNHLDYLDPGLSKRPSRFDRKYLFPLPASDERIQYCEFWRKKLESSDSIAFPEKLCNPMAEVTDNFSFAYMKECFVATLVVIAQKHSDKDSASEHKQTDNNEDDLERYELWREFKVQAKLLREDIDNTKAESGNKLGGKVRGLINRAAWPSDIPLMPPSCHPGRGSRGQHEFLDLDDGRVVTIPAAHNNDNDENPDALHASQDMVPLSRLPRGLHDGAGGQPVEFGDGDRRGHERMLVPGIGGDSLGDLFLWPDAVIQKSDCRDEAGRVKGFRSFWGNDMRDREGEAREGMPKPLYERRNPVAKDFDDVAERLAEKAKPEKEENKEASR